MMKKGFLISAWGLWFCVALTGISVAAEEPKVFSLYWENDVFAGTDRDYSNGLRLSWTKPYQPSASGTPSFTDKAISRLPWVNDPDSRRSVFFTVGQNVYTPANTKTSALIENDRPYAGFLYTTFGASAEKDNRRNSWEFDIGVVGPWSLAEESQNIVHDAIHTSRAEGWDHQLNNELTLGAAFESSWRLWQTRIGNSFGIELIPHLGGHVGNVAVYANTGAELRWGWFLPRDFGTCPIRPGCDSGGLPTMDVHGRPMPNRWGVQFFVAADGSAVLHNIFLDGNTFSDSHSVERKVFVGETMIGMAIHYNSLQLSYAYIQRSKEFDEQGERSAFGAVKLTYNY